MPIRSASATGPLWVGLWILLSMSAVGSPNAFAEDSTTKPAEPTTKSASPTTKPVKTPRAPGSRAASTVVPRNAGDLKEIEQLVKAVVKKCSPATVGVQLGNSQGSGVIVSKDGIVLTAGHVAQEPDKDVFLIMPDGKRVKGKTLGMNRAIDSGMIKITEPGEWPFAEIGTSADLKPGQWVVALGHPGGYRKDRPPVLRIGRILTISSSLIDTDCTLVGGDSGGPLFDLDGKVVGIHSRIGGSTLSNIHVPADTFTDTWERLTASEAWGNDRFGAVKGPVLGITGEAAPGGCRIAEIAKDGPGAKAGLKVGDLIAQLDGRDVNGLDQLANMVGKHKAGDEVKLQVTRGEEKLEIKVTLGKRPG